MVEVEDLVKMGYNADEIITILRCDKYEEYMKREKNTKDKKKKTIS